MPRLRACACLALLLWPVIRADAATYYVTKTGNNANPCSQAAPCLTIAYGLTRLSSGDTLDVGAGQYNERLVMGSVADGTASAYTTLRGAGMTNGTKLFYTGQDPAIEFNATKAYIEIRDLEIDRSGSVQTRGHGVGTNYNSHHIRFRNMNVHHASTIGFGSDTGTSNLEYINVHSHSCGQPPSKASWAGFDTHDPGYCHGYYVGGTGHKWIGGSMHSNSGISIQGYGPGQGDSGDGTFANFTITNMLIYNNIGAGGIYIVEAPNGKFYNNTVTDNPNGGILISGTNTLVTNNIAWNNGGTNIYQSTSNNLQVDPHFVNPSSRDYHLQADSPAINAGTNAVLADVPTDADGVARPNGTTIDIGAYEFVTGETPLTPTSELGLHRHPRLLMTQGTIPAMRNAIATYYLPKWNEYLAWLVNAELTNESGEISHQGLHFNDHNLVRTRAVHHCLVYALGDVPGAVYPQTRAWHADRAITSAIAHLTARNQVGIAAALVYDWCYNAMTAAQRTQMGTLIAAAPITRNEGNITVSMNNPVYTPGNITSSQYYESAHPWYFALALFGDGVADNTATIALDSFGATMLNYGYLDTLNWVCRGGGWDEWIGYSNWHPRIHLYNLWMWLTATGDNYLANKGTLQTAEAGLCLKDYARFLWYAVDPWRYTDTNNAYNYVTLGGAEVGGDPRIQNNRSQQELLFAMPRALLEAGLPDEAGLVRYFLDHHDVMEEFVSLDYEPHWVGGWLGLAKMATPITPDSLGLPLSNWSPNIGLFLARTGFGRAFDTVFALTGGHIHYSTLRGTQTWNEINLTKFGPLMGARRVGHRSLGNLSAYTGAQSESQVAFAGGHLASRDSLQSAANMQQILAGQGNFEEGGIEQVIAQEGVYYYVRANYDRSFDGSATSKRQAVFLPGPNPEVDSDFLVVYDQTTGPTLATYYYHVPWNPDVTGETGTSDLASGSGETGRIGTEYTGTAMTVKARNDVLGNEDALDNCADAPSSLNAHGVLFHTTLLPTGHKYQMTRVASFDTNVCTRQGEFALMSRRWQVAVVPTSGTGTQTFLNVYQTGDSTRVTSMQATTLLNPGSPTQGVFLARADANHLNYAVVFNSAGGTGATAYSYTISGTGTTRHIITGLKPATYYDITETTDSSFAATQQSQVGASWDYKGVIANTVTGTLTFDAPGDGAARTYTVVQTGTPPPPGGTVRVQTHVRAYQQHAAEGATPLAAEDTAIAVVPQTTFRARFQIQTTSAGAPTVGYEVACSDDGGTSYYSVADDYQGQRIRFGLDNLVDNVATSTTAHLTACSGTFRAGTWYERQGHTAWPIALGDDECTEIEAVLQVGPTTNVSSLCRLEEATTRTPLTTYSATFQVHVVPPPPTGGDVRLGVIRGLARAAAPQYEYTIYAVNSWDGTPDGDCTEDDWVAASPLVFATNELAGGAAGSLTSAKMLWVPTSDRLCWCVQVADTARITQTSANDDPAILDGEDNVEVGWDTNKDATAISSTSRKVVTNFGSPGAILDSAGGGLGTNLNVARTVGGVANTNNIMEACADIGQSVAPGDIIKIQMVVEDSDSAGVTGLGAALRGTPAQGDVVNGYVKVLLSSIPSPNPADATAPILSSCVADQVTATAARVTCSVDDATSTCTLRGDSTQDDDMSDAPLFATTPLAASGGQCRITVAGLTAGTGYNLQMEAADASNNIGQGAILDVTTEASTGETGCDRYASPTGTGNGLTSSTPYQIASFWPQAAASTSVRTLCLMDGTYTGTTSMIQPTAGLHGTQAAPITVRAINEGAVFIDGQDVRYPLYLNDNTWFVIEGMDTGNSEGGALRVYGTVDSSCRRSTCGPVVIFRRIVAFDSPDGSDTANASGTVCAVQYSDNVLLEDVACFGRGRKAVYAYRNRETTFRRVFAAWGGGGNDTQMPQETFNLNYDAYLVTCENCLALWHRDSTSIPYRDPWGLIDAGQLRHDAASPYWNTYGRVVSTKILGSIAMIRNSHDAQPDAGIWVGGGGNFVDVQDIQLVDVVSYVQTGGTHDSIKPFLLSSYSGTGASNRSVIRGTSIGAAANTIGSGWTTSQFNTWTSPASANIFTGANQANVCFRYVNGVLTTQKLWPWPMDARIVAGLNRASSYHKVTELFESFGSVTGMITGIFGAIPAACTN